MSYIYLGNPYANTGMEQARNNGQHYQWKSAKLFAKIISYRSQGKYSFNSKLHKAHPGTHSWNPI